MQKDKNSQRFLVRHPENQDLNQYWYSIHTIQVLSDEIASNMDGPCAFLSTPSLYFALDQIERGECYVFDIDDKFSKDRGFVHYDFENPDDIPKDLLHKFSMVVIDPPFITKEVWQKYAITAKLLLQNGGRILASTIPENEKMMHELLGVVPQVFKPSIPNLVYQYSLYANYQSDTLSQVNEELVN